MDRAKITADSDILVRIPGALESVGVCMRLCQPGRRSWLSQHGMEGKEFVLGSKWAHVDLTSPAAEVIAENGGQPTDIILRVGFFKWMLRKETRWCCSRWMASCAENQMSFDPEIHHANRSL